VKAAVVVFVLAAGVAAGNANAATGVRVRIKNEMTHLYVEGYVAFASLDGAKPRRVTTASILLPAGAGRHRLHVFIRACDGNCSLLGAPQKRCSAYVKRRETATYHLRDDGCAITVNG
jgi:hypothetical protein